MTKTISLPLESSAGIDPNVIGFAERMGKLAASKPNHALNADDISDLVKKSLEASHRIGRLETACTKRDINPAEISGLIAYITDSAQYAMSHGLASNVTVPSVPQLCKAAFERAL